MADIARKLFAERHADPDAVSVPMGFTIEVAAAGLNCPSCLECNEDGHVFIGEMGSWDGSAYHGGRIVRVRDDGSSQVIADGFSGSITGLAFYEGEFFAIEHAHSSRVYRVEEDGATYLLLDGLPGGGDHPTSDIVVAHSERLYFCQGTRTNSGIVGPDNADWLKDHPELCDVPGQDVSLTGQNFETPNFFGPGVAATGAFKPYDAATEPGQIINGSPYASSSMMRIAPDGGEFGLFAWGLRNPVGLAVHPDGRLFCTDRGMTARGSRSVADGRSYMWHVQEGHWYGWPDYAGAEPVTDPKFKPKDDPQPQLLLKDHPDLSDRPVAILPPGLGIAGCDFSRSLLIGSDDTAFVALMGEPGNGTDGCKVVTIDVATGVVEDFATNPHPGPASTHASGGLERPINVKFDRTGEMIYVLDLGILATSEDGAIKTLENTGVLWRITLED